MVGSAIQVIINIIILAVNVQVHVMINDLTCNRHNFFSNSQNKIFNLLCMIVHVCIILILVT